MLPASVQHAAGDLRTRWGATATNTCPAATGRLLSRARRSEYSFAEKGPALAIREPKFSHGQEPPRPTELPRQREPWKPSEDITAAEGIRPGIQRGAGGLCPRIKAIWGDPGPGSER